MSLAKVVGMAPEEWLLNTTIAASAPANTRTSGTIQRRAGDSALASQQAPFREVWHIEDIYFVGTNPSPDVQVVIKVDGVDQPITPLASSVNIDELSRLKLPITLPIPRGSVCTVDLINIAANGTDALAITFKAKVIRRMVEA
jgi:hypothetical protein